MLSFALLCITGVVLYEIYQLLNYRKNKVFMEAFFIQNPKTILTGKNAIIWGNVKGNVEIKIFSNSLCEYCKIASDRYREIIGKNYPDVKIEFIYYPFNFRKDSLLKTENEDVRLSKIMLSARHDQEFWHFYDLLSDQSQIFDSLDLLKKASGSLNDYKTFIKSYLSGENDSILINNAKLAIAHNVQGTPTVFIDGREFQQWTNKPLLKMILNNSLINNP